MAQKSKPTITLTASLLDVINEALSEVDCEELFPGVTKAVGELNVRTGVADADEGFAGWVCSIDEKGRFRVDADQPFYVKRGKKHYVFDGKKFV